MSANGGRGFEFWVILESWVSMVHVDLIYFSESIYVLNFAVYSFLVAKLLFKY